MKVRCLKMEGVRVSLLVRSGQGNIVEKTKKVMFETSKDGKQICLEQLGIFVIVYIYIYIYIHIVG